jgi:hypothetical protein
MTSAKTIDGKAMHFPGSLIVDSTSVIEPPPQDVLPEIAASIAPEELLLFAKLMLAPTRSIGRAYLPRLFLRPARAHFACPAGDLNGDL